MLEGPSDGRRYATLAALVVNDQSRLSNGKVIQLDALAPVSRCSLISCPLGQVWSGVKVRISLSQLKEPSKAGSISRLSVTVSGRIGREKISWIEDVTGMSTSPGW